ncbi:MAG: S9 family peptidase, partial [Planctomycetaceae bacterium]|nr:S9 family peptidase [Planctomycetaceae bacterium]
HDLSYDELPDYKSDPLADVRAENEVWKAEQAEQAAAKVDSDQPAKSSEKSDSQPSANNAEEGNSEKESKPADDKAKKEQAPRAISVSAINWNDLGNQVCLELRTADNKDRWITTIDLRAKKLNTIVHRRDPAWINWNVASPRWLADSQTIYYTTEASGYAHLYVTHIPSNATRQLTSGEYVTRNVTPSRDGQFLYYKANAPHPGIYEIYRVNVASGQQEQLTQLGGDNDYALSPDETKLLLTHSTAMSPPELWIQTIGDHASATQLTRTVSAEFSGLPWIAPQYVTVPSRAGRPIHARLYLPPGHDSSKPAPAVIFIHGAGYLQNAHQGWSNYFREFMFHSLLAHRGYVVLDMDYRGSAGYGRDWRTAIYRQMGHPEIDDLEDGRTWLNQSQGVDPERVGIYGGSYGGFMTLMALFTRPDTFACGAALRPVTDWAHYNHGYTSNILNTPDVDPMAYAKSSPIEWAEGLKDPLLICHGMVDDNVFFKDTARLAQRLIELRKEDWEVAMYPVEAHGFTRSSSWYDEYRRILELFERHLKP